MKQRRLHRVQNEDSKLGGVSIGLADYFSIDVTLVRVLFVILFFTPFPAFITYAILWIALPVHDLRPGVAFNHPGVERTDLTPYPSSPSIMNNQNTNGSLIGGAVLIILGLIFAFNNFFDINIFSVIRDMWPLLLIGLGVWLIVRDKNKDNDNFPNDSIGGSTNDPLA